MNQQLHAELLNWCYHSLLYTWIVDEKFPVFVSNNVNFLGNLFYKQAVSLMRIRILQHTLLVTPDT